MASRCRYPCFLQFIGATDTLKEPNFITELMEMRLPKFPERQYLSSLRIRASKYFHNQNPPMIHRDIGSANVLLWRQGFQWRAKVSDFGSANFVNSIKTKAPGNPFYSARGSK